MRTRIKFTGYYEAEDHEVDRTSSSGLTAEAFEQLVIGTRHHAPLDVTDLEDLTTELVDS